MAFYNITWRASDSWRRYQLSNKQLAHDNTTKLLQFYFAHFCILKFFVIVCHDLLYTFICITVQLIIRLIPSMAAVKIKYYPLTHGYQYVEIRWFTWREHASITRVHHELTLNLNGTDTKIGEWVIRWTLLCISDWRRLPARVFFVNCIERYNANNMIVAS
jgi:hypothetical protein